MKHHSGIWTMVALWLTALMLGVVAPPAGAAPMRGDLVSIRQTDETYITLRIWGDEFYAVGETLDGYTVVRDPASGLFSYARLSADGRELVSAGVSALEPPPADLPKHVRIRQDAASEKARAVRADFERRAAEAAPDLGYRSVLGPTTGEVVGIVLIIDFSDDPGTIPPGTVADYCNLPGYTGYGNNGSVRDYFHDVSEELLTYTNYVPSAYYRATRTKSYYCDPSAPYGERARQLIIEALTAMNNAGFDFSQYDADDNGYIDALNCFYAGNVWNSWAQGLWPHSSTVTFCADGVCTRRYQITNMGTELKLGTFCHENGHMLMGWPDLYDYDYDSTGVGVFCLMGYGGFATSPVEPCAYMKLIAGWADVTVMSQAQAGVPVPDDGNVVYKFNHPTLTNEYYLIENRQRTARDANLADDGLAIWHVDTEGNNSHQQQTPQYHYLVTLVQADGRWDLEHNRNYGDATDLYSAPGYTSCTPHTNPNTDWWDGSESGLSFMNVSASGAAMTFDFQDVPPSRPENVIADAIELGVALSWRAVAAPDLDHYRVERDTTGLFVSGTVSAVSSDTTYVDGPLVGSAERFYRVFAVDRGGHESAPSDTVSGVPLADQAPSTPTGLAAFGRDGAVEIFWDAAPEIDVAGYHVVRDSTLAFAAAETLGFPPASPFVDATCPVGVGFWYRVTAEDNAGHLSGTTAPVAGVAVAGGVVWVDDSNTSVQIGSYEYPYRTIQPAIEDAEAGDVVVVLPGAYGSAVELKDEVPLVGMSGAESTTIGGGVSAVGAGRTTVLKGFRIDGQHAVATGLDCYQSDLVVEDCAFADLTSAGASCHHGSGAVLKRNSFTGNQVGIACADSAVPVVRSNVFAGNSFTNIASSGSPGPMVGGSLSGANDFQDHAVFAVFSTGASPVRAELNWWGDDCVDPAWFFGGVDYTPWTDETHTLTFNDCWTGVSADDMPLAAYAAPPFPNPTTRGCSMAFGLPEPGGAVTLRIYSASGRLVRTLVDGAFPPGHHAVVWDGRDDRGLEVPSGVYFSRLDAPGIAWQGKVVRLR